MTVPATSRQTRTFEDRADALAQFFVRAAEAPRLLAYDDAVGCPLDQALAAIEWTVAVVTEPPGESSSTQMLAGWFATGGTGVLFLPRQPNGPYTYCEVGVDL